MLRRLVALLLVLALALGGSIAWLYWDWRQEQASIAWVTKQSHGSIETSLIGPEWLQNRAGRWQWLLQRTTELQVGSYPPVTGKQQLRKLRRLRKVQLFDDHITNDWMTALAGLPELEMLHLERTQVDADGLKRLGRLPRLRVLVYLDGPLADPALDALAGFPELRELHINYAGQVKPTVLALHHAPKLELLSLQGTPIDDEALAALRYCGELKLLNLSQTRVTGAGMQHLAGLNKLEVLVIDYPALRDGGTDAIAQLRSLKELRIGGAQVGRSRIRTQDVQRAFPNIRVIRN